MSVDTPMLPLEDDDTPRLEIALAAIERRLDAILADEPDCLKLQAVDEGKDATGIVAKLNATINAVKKKLCTSGPVEVLDNFVCMGHAMTDSKGRAQRKILFIAGQESNVRGAVRKKKNDKCHEWETLVGFHCKVNPVGFRDNLALAIRAHIKMVMDRETQRRVQVVEEQNLRLREEIKRHNSTCTTEERRTFRKEMLRPTKVHRNEIPITSNRTYAVYTANELVSFEDLLDVIRSSREEAEKVLAPTATAPEKPVEMMQAPTATAPEKPVEMTQAPAATAPEKK